MIYDSPEKGASPTPLRAWQGWWPLAATLLLSTLLVALIVRNRDENPVNPHQRDVQHPPRARILPQPPDTAVAVADVQNGPWNIVTDMLEGIQIFRIRTHANGDELIVDAATGRLLAVRDQTGKTLSWPMSPMNVMDHPPKNS